MHRPFEFAAKLLTERLTLGASSAIETPHHFFSIGNVSLFIPQDAEVVLRVGELAKGWYFSEDEDDAPRDHEILSYVARRSDLIPQVVWYNPGTWFAKPPRRINWHAPSHSLVASIFDRTTSYLTFQEYILWLKSENVPIV